MSLLVRNVKVLGAAKELPERADVYVSGEAISAIGTFANKIADEVIDGQGAYLAPGFIDIDTTSDHYLSLFSDPGQESFLKQGITTIIGGYCGASLAPLLYGSLEAIRKWADPSAINIDWHTVAELMATLRRRALGVNFGTLAGHSTVRRAIAGEEIRDLTKNEIRVMDGVFGRAMTEGAFGVSTGLEYVHTRGTGYLELRAIAEKVAAQNGILAMHLRHTAQGIDMAVGEALKLNKETGVSLLINHFLPVLGAEKDYEKAMALLAALPAEANVHFSIYPFAGTVLALYRLLPEWAQNGNLELMRKNVDDAWLAKRIVKELPELDAQLFTIESSPKGSLDGRTLADFMRAYEITDSRQALLELMRITNVRAVVSFRNVNEALLRTALAHPRAIIGSHASAGRESGTFRGLRAGRSVSEFLKQAEANGIPIEEAIRKVTTMPAQKLRLKGRGEIREGYVADLVLIKNGIVRDVVLGGKAVVRDGETTGVLAGKPIVRSS